MPKPSPTTTGTNARQSGFAGDDSIPVLDTIQVVVPNSGGGASGGPPPGVVVGGDSTGDANVASTGGGGETTPTGGGGPPDFVSNVINGTANGSGERPAWTYSIADGQPEDDYFCFTATDLPLSCDDNVSTLTQQSELSLEEIEEACYGYSHFKLYYDLNDSYVPKNAPFCNVLPQIYSQCLVNTECGISTQPSNNSTDGGIEEIETVDTNRIVYVNPIGRQSDSNLKCDPISNQV